MSEFLRYEKDYLWPVTLKDGRVNRYVSQFDAEQARILVKLGKTPKPCMKHRLRPFGEGIKAVFDQWQCWYDGLLLGTFNTLPEALHRWNDEENYDRFVRDRDAEQAAIDSRYYGDLTYDKDGYKVFKPRPLHA